MADRARWLGGVTLCLALAVVGGITAPPAGAQEPTELRLGDPVDLGVYGQPIRFSAPDGVVIELGSGRRLVDTVEFRPSPVGNGVTVIAEMGMEEYVAGIAEMPARWPLAALKSQAVAARTYGWYQAALGTYQSRGLPYDICATTACQVFEGRSVIETPVVGQRWQRAVAETAGQVLLHEGKPILARYFSTSGGQTRNNEDIFPSSGAFPYLRGIDDPDDAVSPLHRWKAVFTRAQFDALLARGQTLGPASPIQDARVVKEAGSTPNRVMVTGQDGTRAEVTAGQLQDFFNSVAPELYPEAFPGPRADGGSLPSTVPSSRFDIEVTAEEVILHGSGWGHGVGMGQYGAKGKAERGVTYDEILSTYYNGLRPTTSDTMPMRLRVGLADDLDRLSLSADGPMEVRVGDQVVTNRALGAWTVRGAPERTARLVAPPGYGAPLVVDPTTASRTRPFAVETIQLETVVNKPAELVVDVQRDGKPVHRQHLGVVDPGRHRRTWSLAAADGPLPPGSYDVRLLAIDEEGSEAGDAVPITVEAALGTGRPPSVLPDRVVEAPGLPVGAAPLAGLAGLAAGAVAGRRRSEPT